MHSNYLIVVGFFYVDFRFIMKLNEIMKINEIQSIICTQNYYIM